MSFPEFLENEDFENIERMLKNGVDPNKIQIIHGKGLGFGWIPLEFIAEQGNGAIAELLVLYGANVNEMTSDAPIHRAALFNRVDMVKFLLSKGTDRNIFTKKSPKNTPLHIAAEVSHLSIVEILLSEPDVECLLENDEGQTAYDLSESELIKAIIKQKSNEQENVKLSAKIKQLKLTEMDNQIQNKENEITDLASFMRSTERRCVQLSEDIAMKMHELEVAKTKYPLAVIEQPAPSSYLTVEEQTLECPCCLEVPKLPRLVFQCENSHILCSKCAETLVVKQCPQCRSSLTRKTRNRQIERVIASHQKIFSNESLKFT